MTVVLVPRSPQIGKLVKVHGRTDPVPVPAPDDVHVEVHTGGGVWEPLVGYDGGIPPQFGDPAHGVDLSFTPGPPRFTQPGPFLVRVRWTRGGATVQTEPFTLSLRAAAPGPPTPADLLTIEVRPSAGGNCGRAEQHVRWHVANALNGWVIQHIRIGMAPLGCNPPGVPVPSPFPKSYEYWEAWQVVDGRVFIGNTGVAVSVTADLFRLPNWGTRTYGSQRIDGHVRFIPDFNLTIPPWAVGVIVPAGRLPTLQVPPPGWDDATALEHRLDASWDCCSGSQPTTVEAVPLAGIPVPEHRAPGGRPSRAERLLASMPAWTTLGPRDRRRRREVAQVTAELDGFKTDALRRAVTRYLARTTDPAGDAGVDAMSRVYVLNRYVFDVPTWSSVAEARMFGGWNIPVDERRINILYPWSHKGGRLVLDGTFGGYFGHEYLGVQEFDHFAERYGRRRAP